MMRSAIFFPGLFVLSLSFTFNADAEQFKQFGDYSIYYSAFTTDILTPDVARAYNITRSKSHAMLNISVLKKGATNRAVRARIEANAVNLSSQLKTLEMRELNDQDAIYYVAVAPVANQETLRFNLSVTPEGEENTYSFTFQQMFFTN